MKDTSGYKKRKSSRHEAGIPIEISMGDLVVNSKEYLKNISVGGLCFKSNVFVKPATPVRIKVPLVHPIFESMSQVIWCKRNGDVYDVGVEFAGPKDLFKIRMLEQICDIEEYKKYALEKEGRVLSSEEAALEWIGKFADKFPEE
jgi:hypothetical protein